MSVGSAKGQTAYRKMSKWEIEKYVSAPVSPHRALFHHLEADQNSHHPSYTVIIPF
jgi:hypothetical protein